MVRSSSYTRLGSQAFTPITLRSSSKPDRVHICTISGAIRGTCNNYTLENTPLTNHASTSTNPNPIISPAFVEANYEVLESLLKERRRQKRNEDLRTELEYFSKEYDEEREMEPRPVRNRGNHLGPLYEVSGGSKT
ncbi:hypothetical protein Tco_0881334 [Tanacetum coccineum]